MSLEVTLVVLVALGVAGLLVWRRRPKRNPDLPPETPVIRIDPTPLIPHLEAMRGSLQRIEGRFLPTVPTIPLLPPPTHPEVQRIHDAYEVAIREQHEHEKEHPVPYSPNVRHAAIVKRAKDKLA